LSILLIRLLSNTICPLLLYDCPLIARMRIPVEGVLQNEVAIFLFTENLLD